MDDMKQFLNNISVTVVDMDDSKDSVHGSGSQISVTKFDTEKREVDNKN